jgi:hypothetical protein
MFFPSVFLHIYFTPACAYTTPEGMIMKCSHDGYNFVIEKHKIIVIKKIHCWAMVICLQYWIKILAATNLMMWSDHSCDVPADYNGHGLP